MSAAVLLECQELVVTIADTQVCNGLTLQIRAGECWAILGRNGVGKSTLLHTLAGLQMPLHGTVMLRGEQLSTLSRRTNAQQVGVLLQDYTDIFSSDVLQTALMGRHPYLHPWQWETSQDLLRARSALGLLDIANLEQRDLNTLSGGERRRAHLATLLTQDPAIYLLDEPTNHLDVRHQIRTFELLRNLANHNGKALVATLHDVNLAARFCDHALLLFGEGVTLHGSTMEVLNENNLARLLQHPMQQVTTPHGKMFIPG